MVGLVESVIQSLNFPNELEPLQLEGSDEQALVLLLATAISPEHRQEQLKRKQRQQVLATQQDESDNQAQRAPKRKAEEEVKLEVEGPTGTIVQAPAAKRPASEDFKDRIATRAAISLQAPELSPKFVCIIKLFNADMLDGRLMLSSIPPSAEFRRFSNEGWRCAVANPHFVQDGKRHATNRRLYHCILRLYL